MCKDNGKRLWFALLWCSCILTSHGAHAFREVPGAAPVQFFSLDTLRGSQNIALPSRYSPHYYPIAAKERTASMPVQVDHSVRDHAMTMHVDSEGKSRDAMDEQEAKLLLFIFSADE